MGAFEVKEAEEKLHQVLYPTPLQAQIYMHHLDE
jgi:hypothetical protein